jgi:hypothetical protein
MSSPSAFKVITALHTALDFSIDMVAMELEKVPEAEMESVLREVARHVTLLQEMQYPNPTSWASIVEQELGEADLCYVRMTPSEFEREKQAAKRDRRFGSWEEWRNWVERIDGMRRPPAPPRRRTALEMLYAERLDILKYPAAMFASEESMRAALKEVDAEILKLGGRIERTDEEREVITNIDARLRQARALKSCRRFLAARSIQALFRRAESSNATMTCDLCSDEFKRKDVYETTTGLYCGLRCSLYARKIRPVF